MHFERLVFDHIFSGQEKLQHYLTPPPPVPEHSKDDDRSNKKKSKFDDEMSFVLSTSLSLSGGIVSSNQFSPRKEKE